MDSPTSTAIARPEDGPGSRLRTRIAHLSSEHPVLFVLLLALFVRVFIAIVLTKYFSGTLVLDDTTYHFMAEQMAAGNTSGWDDFTYELFYSTSSFTLPVTALYKIFEPIPLVGQLFVVVMGTIAAGFVTRIAMEFMSTRMAIVAGSIVALLPSQAFWSSMLMKDASVWFTLTGVGVVVAIGSRATGKHLAVLAVPAGALLIMLSYLRLHTLVVAAWAFMIAAFFGIRRDRLARIGGALALGIAIPWLFGAIGPAGLSLVMNHGSLEERRFQNAIGANTAFIEEAVPPEDEYAPPADQISVLEEAERLEQEAESLEREAAAIDAEDPAKAEALRERVQALRERVETVRASVAPPPPPALSDSGDSLTPEIAHLPRGLSVMLIEPLPVPFSGSLSLRLARLESLLWYPLLILAAIGLWRVRAYLRSMVFPLLMGGGILLTYALSEGNIGTAHRHRGEFVWVVALLAATGVSHLLSHRRETPTETA